MPYKVVYHDGPTKLEQIGESTLYDNAVRLASAMRYFHVQHDTPDAHFGVVHGDFLRWSSRPLKSGD